MKILVVCAAGASSTFVARRLRTAAHAAGLTDWNATAGTESSLGVDVDSVDLVLIGPHLAARAAELAEMAAQHGAALATLPDDIFSDLTGARTLDLTRAVLGIAPAKGTS